MRPIAEYAPMDRATFEREIVAKGEPAVFRGLVADWPAVQAGADGPEVLAPMLQEAATDEPIQAWFAPPEVGGRFDYNADFSGFNFNRRMTTIGQLLELLLTQRGREQPFTMYAGGLPIAKLAPALMSCFIGFTGMSMAPVGSVLDLKPMGEVGEVCFFVRP